MTFTTMLNNTRMKILDIFKSPQGFILGLWLLSSLVAIFVPVSIWSHNRNKYYQYVGVYNEYAAQQSQYEQQQQNNNNNNNNYANYGNPCSWWNYSCKKKYAQYEAYFNYNNNGNNNQNNNQNQIILPGWYTFLGGKVQIDEREAEEMGISQETSSGSIKFVYSWTLILFLALIGYGSRILYSNNKEQPGGGGDRSGLLALLILYMNFLLLNLLTVVNGVIETEERQLEDSIYGWSGQWGVLVAYTDFWMLLHSLIFSCVFGIPSCIQMMKSNRRGGDNNNNAESSSSTVEMANNYANMKDDDDDVENGPQLA